MIKAGKRIHVLTCRVALEFQLGTLLSLHSEILGRPVNPVEIRIVYPEPPNAAEYEGLLRCPVRFGQARNEMRFSHDWLEQKLAFANPITAALVRETCDQRLAEPKAASGVAGTMLNMLIERPGHFPDVEAVAGQLHMTSRTLRKNCRRRILPIKASSPMSANSLQLTTCARRE